MERVGVEETFGDGSEGHGTSTFRLLDPGVLHMLC